MGVRPNWVSAVAISFWRRLASPSARTRMIAAATTAPTSAADALTTALVARVVSSRTAHKVATRAENTQVSTVSKAPMNATTSTVACLSSPRQLAAMTSETPTKRIAGTVVKAATVKPGIRRFASSPHGANRDGSSESSTPVARSGTRTHASARSAESATSAPCLTSKEVLLSASLPTASAGTIEIDQMAPRATNTSRHQSRRN